jgi:hypothetical protein
MAAAVIILGSFMQHVCRYFEALPIQATPSVFINFESKMKLLWFPLNIDFQMNQIQQESLKCENLELLGEGFGYEFSWNE